MRPTNGAIGPVLMPCPGTVETDFQVDGQAVFVRVLYNGFYERDPDDVGGRYWRSQITQCHFDFGCIHSRRTAVAYAFCFSPETWARYPEIANPPGSSGFDASTYNPAFVTNCYERFLQRLPDPGGYDYWLGELNSGRRNYQQLVEEFTGCLEFHIVWN